MIIWSPVIAIDIVGSILTLVLAFWCAIIAREWSRKKSDDVFRQYIFLLTISIVFFAISRSFGHLVKQILLLNNMSHTWGHISPFSGAINSTAFVVIFAFGIYFYRFQKVHVEIEKYKNNLEEMIDQRTAELNETNLTLENVLNSSNPICITDVDFMLMRANDAYYQIWPVDQTTPDNVKCYESRPGAHCDTDLCPLKQIIGGKDEVVLEVDKESCDGKKNFIVTARPYYDEDGNLLGIVESFQDITKRKLAELALASERERLTVTLRSIGDGVITTDTSGNIVLINKIGEQLTGWSQNEAVGRPLEEVFNIINEKTLEKCANPVSKVLETGTIIALENHTVLIAKDGTHRSIADSGAPIRDEHSEIIGVVLVFRDVTEQQKMEEELLNVEKLKSVGVLAGGIAHDFNNILAAILGNINLARLDTSMRDRTQKLLEAAEKASLRAKNLTQQLLTFAKGGEPVKETSSLQEVIKDSANFVLHGEKVSCDYSFADDLHLVDIDKGQFSQVIQNIIINANHAMPEGGIIKVDCKNIESTADHHYLPGKNYIQVEIQDTGIGIPDNVIDKVFDPYFSTKRKGSGLGLAICKSIITKHDGFISVESVPGKGTTFTITLPASDSLQAHKEIKEEKIAAVGKAKILVMDDEEMVLNVAQAMLTELGHTVLTAKDGAEAIEIFKHSLLTKEPVELTIMDLTIPGGHGGKEAVLEFLEISPTAKVVVCSGYSNDPIMANYKDYGFCGAIVKPFEFSELTRVLGQALGK